MFEDSRLRVLVVDDDPDIVRSLERYICKEGHEVLTASNGVEAKRILSVQGAQIVITDIVMSELDGLELTRAIRSNEAIPFCYIILLTAHSSKQTIIDAFDAGADDYMTKPLTGAELLARFRAGVRITRLTLNAEKRTRELHLANAQLAILNETLNRLATIDELTGTLNRREAMTRLSDHWKFARRYNEQLSCIMLDVDHFKEFNDTHGHVAGDAVLRATAERLLKKARGGEAVCRIGGEEFLILCPKATASEAAKGAERLRKAVEENEIRSGDQRLRVTVSLGVAERTPNTKCLDDLLRAADDALYAAKKAGRNRVCVAGVESAQITSAEAKVC